MTLTYEDFEQRIEDNPTVILSLGSFEQHGKHGPMTTDTLIPEALTETLSEELDIVKLPTLPYGLSDHHMKFPGTVTIDQQVYESFVKEILSSLKEHGVEKIILFIGHGGNLPAVRNLKEDTDLEIHPIIWWKVIDGGFDEEESQHAGSLETSMVKYIDEELVKDSKVVDEKIDVDFNPKEVEDITNLTESGVMGKAKTYSKERGEKYFKNLVDELKDEIKEVMEEDESKG